MGHRLWLLRHAKSSWDVPDEVPDHDRPLAPRGRRALVALRDHLAETGGAEASGSSSPAHPDPLDLVLCSTARRTVETWEGIAAAFPADTSVEGSHDLYGASATGLLHRLRQLPASAGAVLVIGHNPGIGDLARGLAGSGDAGLLRQLQGNYPTGALAMLLVPEPWIGLRWGAAELTGYVIPRDLPG